LLLLMSALRGFRIVALGREINQLLIQRGELGGIQLMAERNRLVGPAAVGEANETLTELAGLRIIK
jgi:hypothetical protein